jgi:hypothetical protein
LSAHKIGIIRVFGRLDRLEKANKKSSSIDFFRTHPASEKRSKLLEEMLPEAFAVQAESPDCAGMQDELNAFRGLSDFGRQ